MRIGLIGDPVAHSASPKMQGAAFAEANLHDWTYELWPTPLNQLRARIDALRYDASIGGCNVTVPHKQNVMPLIDAFSDDARALGAVNTIVKRNGQLWGDNTDWRGFMADLTFHDALPKTGASVLVLGAGGSARGIAYGLLKHGYCVQLHNRDAARAATLISDLRRFGDIEIAKDLYLAGLEVALIVNCTSAGMSPNVDSSPWPDYLAYPAQCALYDLVYKPRSTRLMQHAEAAGARVIGGIGMLAEQGAAAFELWTAVPAARVAAVMRAALD
jgi:shikimate dehydrogenase